MPPQNFFKNLKNFFEKSVDKTQNRCYINQAVKRGRVVQSVRTPACHAGGRGFKSLRGRQMCPFLRGTNFADIAQQVERILGKDEVASSNLASSSKTESPSIRMGFFVLVAAARFE